MGKEAKHRPTRLGEKLFQIRQMLGLSQYAIIDYLGLSGVVDGRNISNYETNKREPSSLLILAYARAARVSVDVLLDDDLSLPSVLASNDTSTVKKKASPPMTAKIILKLDIQSRNGSGNSVKKVRTSIEKKYLKKYSMKVLDINENKYELQIPYIDELDLDKRIRKDIVESILIDAHNQNCNIMWNAWDKDTTSYW